MTHKIAILPGDGVGPEIMGEAARLLQHLQRHFGLDIETETSAVGGAAIDAQGTPLPTGTLELARDADAVLLGAVGGPRWDEGPAEQRPEAGLLRLRSELGLFANLRPALLYPELAADSALKPDLVAGLDLLIVRELTGGIYFGRPRGIETAADGTRFAYNTMRYTEAEIERIARQGFASARQRNHRLCSVDKANVLEVSQLWREVVTRVHAEYPDVALSHMYVDNAAMQLVRDPRQFDVVVTGNLFGDILSDCAAMLTGSIGMLPSASLDENGKGMYEPVHGSAPDIAGKGCANPLAMILSVAMLLRYSLHEAAAARAVERAVGQVLADGIRTADIAGDHPTVATEQMGRSVIAALERVA